MSGYAPTVWVNGGAPALSAENLNKIELGLSRALGYDTKADLATADRPTTVQTAWARGAMACDDGGGGWWIWDGAATRTDAVHLLPTGHVGAGRWVPLVLGPIDLRLAGTTSVLENASANWEALNALCRYLCLERGGGEIWVPDIGAPFTVDGGVPPQYLDHLHIRGPGEIRNVNPGSTHNKSRGVIFYGGTYGPHTGAQLAFSEAAFDIEDADAGAAAVTLVTPEEASGFSVGDLVMICDGSLVFRSEVTTKPRYLYPHVREVLAIDGADLHLDQPLRYGVANDPVVRRLNTGDLTFTTSPWPEITSAYLARDFSIECNLSAAFDYNEITGEPLPTDASGNTVTGLFYNGGFRASYKGRFKSKNGLTANFWCSSVIDADVVCGDGRAFDGGYGTSDSDITIRLSHDVPETSMRTTSLVFMAESSHSCRLNVSTPTPIYTLTTGSNMISSTCSFGWDCHLDISMPNRKSRAAGVPVSGGLLHFGYEDEDTETGEPTGVFQASRDMHISGRIAALEAYSLINFGAPGEGILSLERATSIKDFVFECPTISDPSGNAIIVRECGGVTLKRVSGEAVGDLTITGCSDITLLHNYLPGCTAKVLLPTVGFWANVHDNTFANLMTTDELLTPGQINTQANGTAQVGGPLQVLGQVYTARITLALPAGGTINVKTAAELGEGNTYLVHATHALMGVSGLAFVRVYLGACYVSSIFASGVVWGSAGGAALTLTDSTGIARNVYFNLLQL